MNSHRLWTGNDIHSLLQEKPDLRRQERLVGNDMYICRYDDESEGDLSQALGKMAADKDLNITWFDIAVLAQERRRELQQSIQGKESS
jgi:hypothetical protein